MPREVHATMTEVGRVWLGSVEGSAEHIRTRTRRGCLSKLRDLAGDDVALVVEVTPALVGVSEAAAILGWDRRRVITYVDRGSFPDPIARLASGRVWRRRDVEAFARAWRRRRQRRRAR
ncbi:MAG: hypothetical protein AB1551_04680 [Actinomycetota bacterium]